MEDGREQVKPKLFYSCFSFFFSGDSMVVRIFSTRHCPYCKLTKDFLTNNKIEFVEVDVSDDMEAAKEMVEKTGQMGVPVLDVNGRFIIGFNKAAMKDALGLQD